MNARNIEATTTPIEDIFSLHFAQGDKLRVKVGENAKSDAYVAKSTKYEYDEYEVVATYPHYVVVTNGLYNFSISKWDLLTNSVVCRPTGNK